MRQIAEKAIAQGWTVDLTNGGHLRFVSPAGSKVFAPSTPRGGRRSTANTKADLKRAGLEL